MKTFRSKARAELNKRGFTFVDNQHNGQLFVRLDSDKFLHRRLVDVNGTIKSYVTRKATKRELELYGLV